MSATKVAIVTAADSGIGKQCALMLAEQGFDIGITGIPMNKAPKRRPGTLKNGGGVRKPSSSISVSYRREHRRLIR